MKSKWYYPIMIHEAYRANKGKSLTKICLVLVEQTTKISKLFSRSSSFVRFTVQSLCLGRSLSSISIIISAQDQFTQNSTHNLDNHPYSMSAISKGFSRCLQTRRPWFLMGIWVEYEPLIFFLLVHRGQWSHGDVISDELLMFIFIANIQGAIVLLEYNKVSENVRPSNLPIF